MCSHCLWSFCRIYTVRLPSSESVYELGSTCRSHICIFIKWWSGEFAFFRKPYIFESKVNYYYITQRFSTFLHCRISLRLRLNWSSFMPYFNFWELFVNRNTGLYKFICNPYIVYMRVIQFTLWSTLNPSNVYTHTHTHIKLYVWNKYWPQRNFSIRRILYMYAYKYMPSWLDAN